MSAATLRLKEAWDGGTCSAKPKKPPAPTSIRFSEEQKAKLKKEANGKPIGVFVRAQLFDDDGSLRPHIVRPVDDPKVLAQVLGKLGQSNLANNLNQMTKLAHSGALPVSPEVCQELTRACREVSEMRAMLVKALGLRGRR
jgi:hypothetical protein